METPGQGGEKNTNHSSLLPFLGEGVAPRSCGVTNTSGWTAGVLPDAWDDLALT